MAFLVYEIPIGKTFNYNNKTYEVLKAQDDTCKGCAFENNATLCGDCKFLCTSEFRCDCNNVIFKEKIKDSN